MFCVPHRRFGRTQAGGHTNSKLQIVLLGIMGRTPVAGVAWQALHYLEGARRLGHEVHYVEDTQTWPYNPETATNDCFYTVKYIDRLMRECGLGDRWTFCDTSQAGRVYGRSAADLASLYERADILINLTGSSKLTDAHRRIPVRAYLETDPGVPQIEIAQGDRFTIDFLATHTHHFTFAENYGKPGCLLPVGPFRYYPTRQPVVVDWWQTDAGVRPKTPGGICSAATFTTIASWQQSNDIVWNGETYTWSKDQQFLKFIDLPSRLGQPVELALACDDVETIGLLRAHGWRISDAVPLTQDIFPYRDFIISSRGEFTVAKDQYVRLRTGWFSDRSACYLAAGRPVVTQDTGFESVIKSPGEGLFAFETMNDIMAAFEAIDADYERHSRAAQAIAEEYFRAETVIGKLLEDAGL
jgi:hypothetical protein